jgi:CheY-like chemotaxis protein
MNKTTAEFPTLLLANYQRDSNTAMAALLWQEGYEVETAETLSDAVVQLGHQRFDLFLCRVGMPDGCGAEAIVSAWRQFQTPGVAIFGSHHSQQIVAKVPRDAMRGELFIPCGGDQIFEVVSAALGRPRRKTPATGNTYLEGKNCPDCRGAGNVALLLSRGPCRTCAGKGRVPQNIRDIPLRDANGLSPTWRRALYRIGARTLGEAIDSSGSDLRRAGFSEAMLGRLIGGCTAAAIAPTENR